MFETADMSRLTVAAPVGKIEDVLRTCASLGCVHIEEYGNFEDGIGVGKSINTDNSEHISQMIIKARALQAELNATNTGGAKSAVEANKLTISMGDKVDSALALVDQIRDAQSDIANLEERIKALSRVEPLGIPLELMAGFEGLEIYIAETAKSSKAHVVFADMISEIELQTSPGIIAVACKSSDGAAVQIGLSELGAKPIQIPAGEGSPGEMIATAKSKVSSGKKTLRSGAEDGFVFPTWGRASRNTPQFLSASSKRPRLLLLAV